MKGEDSTSRPPKLKAYTGNLKNTKDNQRKTRILEILLGGFHSQGLRRLVLGLHSKLRSIISSRSIATRIELLGIISPQEFGIIFVNVIGT
jgi:hypothetical protein